MGSATSSDSEGVLCRSGGKPKQASKAQIMAVTLAGKVAELNLGQYSPDLLKLAVRQAVNPAEAASHVREMQVCKLAVRPVMHGMRVNHRGAAERGTHATTGGGERGRFWKPHGQGAGHRLGPEPRADGGGVRVGPHAAPQLAGQGQVRQRRR